MLYIGGFGSHRGIDTAIRSLKYLQEDIPDIRLVLVGNASTELEEKFASLAREDGVLDLIVREKWTPFENVYSYMKAADIGLIPHNLNEHTDNTIPHKLFQHMMVGKPVLVSTCKPLARIVADTGSGAIFEAGNAEDFASKVKDIYNNSQKASEMGENGVAATLAGNFNWQHTAGLLTNLYSDIVSRNLAAISRNQDH